jgi:hypothetical protein
VKILVVAFLAAGIALGQQPAPQVTNGRLETLAFSGNLASQIKSPGAAWFGYAIKTRRGDHDSCCCNNADGEIHSAARTQPVHLEGNDTLALLFRVESNQVQKIRFFSLECSLDPGGLPFTWITGVPAAQSIAFIKNLIHSDAGTRITNQGILALSLHDDPAAVDSLIQLARADPSTHIREQALFWLAQKAGTRAASTITDAILNDPDTNVKKRAVFALSQLPNGDGVPKLIEVARSQRNPEVRKQAFFWLGQSKDPRALAFIEDVLK